MRGKRIKILTLCGLMLAFLILGGISPVGNGDEDAIVADYIALPMAPGQVDSLAKEAAPLRQSSGGDAFNAQYQNQWKATFSKKTGKVSILYGASSRRYENGPESVAKGFLSDSYAIFGLKGDLSDLKTLRVDETPTRDHVKLQQTHQGVPVYGALVLVHSDQKGQVTMVQNGYIQELRVTNQSLVTEEAAKKAALDDLRASLEQGATIYDAKAEQVIVPWKGEYRFIWKITVPTRDPFGLWVYHIDAASAEILYKGNEILSLKKGVGRAYKTNPHWHMGRISNAPLKNMFTPDEGNIGYYLYGLHADVYDDNYNDPQAPDYRFLYDPYNPTEKPWFDATHTYYQMNTIWDWWEKKVLRRYGPYSPAYFYTLSIPVLVNMGSYCGASYTWDWLGSGIPGFYFGNEGSCAAGSEDLAIDNDVFRHEYTHAMTDWCGFDTQFFDLVNNYGRSMGEGNADWFAYLFSKDPQVGDVAWDWSGAGYLRNLDNTRMYPWDVDYPLWGTPEEHYTGEIWGGYLYDLYQNLRGRALPYVYNAFSYFIPSGGHRASYPDFYDAIWAQVNAEIDLTGGYRSSAKAWGSMAGRGINGALRAPYSHGSDYFYTGGTGSDTNVYFWWNFPPVRSINTKGNLLLTLDWHEYVIGVTQPGMDLSAMVTARTGGLVNPSIYLYTTGGALLVSVGPTTSTKAVLTYPNIPTGTYVVGVTGTATAPARGYYTFKVMVR